MVAGFKVVMDLYLCAAYSLPVNRSCRVRSVPMEKLDPGQIQYMRDVLGITDVVLPMLAAEADSVAMTDDNSQWRTSGDENAAKIFVLVASSTASFPLDGETGELTRKMIQAMKMTAADAFILEWTHAHTPAPAEISQTLMRTSKPVLIFGAEAARSLIGHFPAIGEWSSWEGVRFVATESPMDLVLRPELKKTAWAHMQVFMKGLSFG